MPALQCELRHRSADVTNENSLAFTLVAALATSAQQSPAAKAAGPDAVKFTVRVENVSVADALKLSASGAAPAPPAPVLWLVHTNTDPLFTTGQLDRGLGLEHLAEDGDPDYFPTRGTDPTSEQESATEPGSWSQSRIRLAWLADLYGS